MTNQSYPNAPANLPERPVLRMVQPTWIEDSGRRFLHLRDPLSLSDTIIGVPEQAAPLVTLLDGSRNLAEIRAALELRFGMRASDQDLRYMIGQLDDALLIENGKYRRARRLALQAYRDAPHRPPSHAGAVYDESAAGLESEIEGWIRQSPGEQPNARPAGELVGMLCPHIDYNRGHSTYAELWRSARPDLDEIETIIVLGTDHNGGFGRITPTLQSYATPYGTLETDVDIVKRLSDAIGPDAFDEELHHRGEHSIELAAVWLHHFTRGRSLRLAPILCGSFYEFTNGGGHPDDSPRISAALEVMERVMAERRTLIVAAGDLAHVGPAFGDSRPLDAEAKSKLESEDAESLSAICAADAERFLRISRGESDRRKLCGLPPIYLALRLLNGARGFHMGYDQRPADASNGSVVSIAGALLYR